MSDEAELKRQLVEILNKNNGQTDYGEILNLASELSVHDESNVRFSVDGNLVKRLGEQLVAKKTTALSELIKNSYDAEATKVEVTFENTEEPGGTITILDDGNGMTRSELIKGFMTISTSEKEENPVSPNYKRPRAGRKGIGRFSAQKIGNKLRIITRKNVDSPFLIIDIDWERYKPNTSLIAVANTVKESYENHSFEKGTKLIISDTKEIWTESHQSTTFKYISSVIKRSPQSSSSGVVDPGFKAVFFAPIPITGEFVEINSEDTEFLSEADAKISSKINEKGKVEIQIKGIKGVSINETFELSETKSTALSQAKFLLNVHYFSLSRDSSRKHLSTYTNENGGIKLYRNGFYVAPYGSKYDDWLGLDDSVRRRRILPPHSNTNFIGGIDIEDIDGSLFDETSSREGLIENIHFDELQDTAYEILTSAVKRIASARGRKVTSNQSGFKSKPKTLESRLEEANQTLSDVISGIPGNSDNIDLLDSDVSDKVAQSAIIDMTEKFKESFTEQQSIIQEIISEKDMYRVLSSTGLAIAEFTHEIQLYLNNLSLYSTQLKRMLKGNDAVLRSVEELEVNTQMLVSYSDFFTDTIRNNSQRKKTNLELRTVIGSFFEAMKPTIERRQYELLVSFEGDDFWTKQMHVSEMSSILINLFTNSCKAIVRAKKQKGKIKLTISSAGEDHVVRFEDNGDGIPTENWSRVFSPMFTTELSKGAYANDGLQNGMGLGLTISQDILYNIDGDISVVNPSEGYSTCIEIIIPCAPAEEVPDNAY